MSNRFTATHTAEVLTRLNEECAAMRAFVALLQQEQQTLLGQDVELLISLAETKTQSAQKLAEMAMTRRQAIRPETDMATWLTANAPNGMKIWEEIRELAASADQLNKTNGEVIQLKLRSNQQALNALMGAAQNTTALYGRDGQPSLPVTGRTLGSG